MTHYCVFLQSRVHAANLIPTPGSSTFQSSKPRTRGKHLLQNTRFNFLFFKAAYTRQTTRIQLQSRVHAANREDPNAVFWMTLQSRVHAANQNSINQAKELTLQSRVHAANLPIAVSSVFSTLQSRVHAANNCHINLILASISSKPRTRGKLSFNATYGEVLTSKPRTRGKQL